MTRTLATLLAALALAPAARAAGPVAVSVGHDNRKMSREECARKAVEAMGVKEKFAFAEVTADGNARGWNATTAVLALSFPMPDPERVFVVVVAAGGDAREAERVRGAVLAHVLDGPYDPKAPARVAPAGDVPPPPCTLCHKFEDRGAVNVLRFFDAAAAITLEKKGYQTQQTPGKALGVLPDRGVLAFVGPTATATTARLNVVSATPADESGEKAAADVLARLAKILYE